jgi:16S rRNA (guanine1207-N2)-methyltransferase
MSHYYTNDPTLDHDVKTFDVDIKGVSLRFYTDRGVFSKDGLDFGTRFLLESIELNSDVSSIIDMGCGYGPVAIYLAKKYPNVSIEGYDINERALDLARKNAHLNQVDSLHFEAAFLFERVQNKVDVILTNPPIRAGKATIFKLYEDAYQYLYPGGMLFVVIQKKQGAPSTVEKLKTLFDSVELIDRNKGYWVLLAKKSKID